MSGKPKAAVLDSALVTSQQRPDPQESTYARAGWNVAGGRLQHNGITPAMFADLRVYPLKGYGVSAMTNVGGAPRRTREPGGSADIPAGRCRE